MRRFAVACQGAGLFLLGAPQSRYTRRRTCGGAAQRHGVWCPLQRYMAKRDYLLIAASAVCVAVGIFLALQM